MKSMVKPRKGNASAIELTDQATSAIGTLARQMRKIAEPRRRPSSRCKRRRMKSASKKKFTSATAEVENAKPTWPKRATRSEFITELTAMEIKLIIIVVR